VELGKFARQTRLVTVIPNRLSARVRALVAEPLLRTAYSLMVNVAVAAGLGAVFWVFATRLYGAAAVGRDAALIAAMMELSTICQLNFVNALARFLPSLERGTMRALLGAYALSGAAALVAGAGFVALAPMISHQFIFLRESWLMAALYVVAQVLWTWFVLQDVALTALRQAVWVPVENGAFGLLRLAALPLFAALGAEHGVFLASVLPTVLVLVPVNLFLFRSVIPNHVRRNRPQGSALRTLGRRRLVGFMAKDYCATVLSQAAATALPLFVVALLGPAANAYFYIPFTIVVAFNMLFYGVTTSLVVEGALAEERIRDLARTLVRRFALLLVPGTALIAAAAPLLLFPFGPDYVSESTPILRILACGCLFRAISMLYMAIARLQGKGSRILAVEATQMALLLAGAAVLATPLGLEGIAISWLVATSLVALAVLPSLVRFLRSPSTGLAVAMRPATVASEAFQPSGNRSAAP
jgi:O-antigen/teichoic acid export membrane protein